RWCGVPAPHQARGDEDGHAVDQTGIDERAVDLAATLHEDGADLALGEGGEGRARVDAAVARSDRHDGGAGRGESGDPGRIGVLAALRVTWGRPSRIAATNARFCRSA